MWLWLPFYSLNWPYFFCSDDEFGPPRVPSGYRSQSPQHSYRNDDYAEDRYSSDNRYAPSRSRQQQQQQRGYDEYELKQTNGASDQAAGDINTMPGYLSEVGLAKMVCQRIFWHAPVSIVLCK